jgi:glycerol-3-phosphate dehydrogenase
MDVVLLVRDAATVQAINERHCNERYLPKHQLPPGVRATTDPATALEGADYIVHAIPVQQSSGALAALKQHIAPTTPILCLSKGLEIGTCRNMSELIPAALGRKQPLAVLSGPTFAVELMAGLPTAIVAASEDVALAVKVQRLFASSNLRVNTSTDVLGVEMAGALKNVLAIAAGIFVQGVGAYGFDPLMQEAGCKNLTLPSFAAAGIATQAGCRWDDALVGPTVRLRVCPADLPALQQSMFMRCRKGGARG